MCRDVSLNGTRLKLSKNGKLPSLHPVAVERSSDAVVPALSYGFVVVKDVKLKPCMKY